MYAVAARAPGGSTSQLLANATAAALLIVRWCKNGYAEKDVADAKKRRKVSSRKAGGGAGKASKRMETEAWRRFTHVVRVVACTLTCLVLGTAAVAMTCQGDSCDEMRLRVAMFLVSPVRGINVV